MTRSSSRMCACTRRGRRRCSRRRRRRNGRTQAGAVCRSISTRARRGYMQQRPRRPRIQRRRLIPRPMPDWTAASCARYGSSLDSSASACAISGAYHAFFTFYLFLILILILILIFFWLVGTSAIRMARARSIARRLRAGWRGSTRSCGGRRCLVVLALAPAGAPRVPAGHCGQSPPVRFSAEFDKEAIILGPYYCNTVTYHTPNIPPSSLCALQSSLSEHCIKTPHHILVHNS